MTPASAPLVFSPPSLPPSLLSPTSQPSQQVAAIFRQQLVYSSQQELSSQVEKLHKIFGSTYLHSNPFNRCSSNSQQQSKQKQVVQEEEEEEEEELSKASPKGGRGCDYQQRQRWRQRLSERKRIQLPREGGSLKRKRKQKTKQTNRTGQISLFLSLSLSFRHVRSIGSWSLFFFCPPSSFSYI